MLSLRTRFLITITSIIIYLFLISYFWNSISLPFNNEDNIIGYLTINNINPLNDTLRFIFFLIPPLILLFLYFRFNYPNKSEKVMNLFSKNFFYKDDYNFSDVMPIVLLFLMYILGEFLSIDLKRYIYLDTLHDGDYLTPLMNYINFNGLWTSSFTIHGGRDLLIPIISLKLFNTINIAPIKYLYLFLIFIIKFLSIILAFQLSRFTNLRKEYKILIFTLLSFFILSISNYYQNAYLGIRDIFVLIFFILLIQIFLKKNSLVLSYLLSATTVISLFFHYDTGIYLNLMFFLFSLYLFLSKKFKEALLIIFFLINNYLIIYFFLGSEEVFSFFNQLLHIINNVDKIHGLEYPQPFFSIGSEENGSRGTRLLVLLLFTGMFVSFLVFLKNNYLAINEKVLILFLYFYTLISFKNALGRSDSSHMMVSSDWVFISFFSFFLFSLFFLISKKINFFYNKYLRLILTVFIFILTIVKVDFYKVINYKHDFSNFIKISNNDFYTNERKVILKKISKVIKKENCIENFTTDLSLPYLLEKPNCTKFFASWLASGKKIENEYIEILKQKKVEYIIYESPYFHVDGIKTNQRLILVDDYIKQNYKEVFNDNELIIVKKSNIS